MVRAYETNQPIGNDQPRGKWVIVSGAVLPFVAHVEMVRFVKKFKFWKRSPKSVPEDTQAHQTNNVDAKSDRQAEGEHRLGKIVELIRQMRLITASHQIQTAQGVLGSQNRTEGPRINRFLPRLPRVRPPGTVVGRRVSEVS